MNEAAEALRRYVEKNDESAFAQFFGRYVDLVYSAALRRTGGNTAMAADITQQVFVAVAQRARSLANHPAVAAWLYTATRNAAFNLMRDAHRHSRLNRVWQQEYSAAPDTSVAWEQLKPTLDAAMDELDERERVAILLRFFAGLSFSEIGQKLRLKENAARMRVDRALDRLRDKLKARGVGSTAAALGVALAQHSVEAAPAEILTAAQTAVAVGLHSGVAIGLLTGTVLMNVNKLILAAGALALVTGVGSAYLESRQVERTRAELARVQTENAQSSTLAQELQARLLKAEQSVRDLDERANAAEKKVVSAPALSAKVSRSAHQNGFANPEYAKATVAQYKAGLLLKFVSFYHAQNLTAEQIARFEAAMVEGFQGSVAIWAAAAQQNLNTGENSGTNTAVARMTANPNAERDKALKSILGNDGFKAFNEYSVPDGSREFTGLMAASLYDSSSPLTAAQGQALETIFRQNTTMVKTRMADDGVAKPLYAISYETNWNNFESLARPLLSEAQLTALHPLIEQKRSDATLRRLQMLH